MCKSKYSSRAFVLSIIFTFLLGGNVSGIIASDAEIDAAPNTQIGFKVAAKQVLNVMNNWARAWAQLDARTYISSYAPDYVGKGFPSHFAWAASRQQRLENQKNINLSLTDVELSSTKQGIFTISFRQKYESDSYKDVTKKQLDFKRINNKWYIISEKSLPRNK